MLYCFGDYVGISEVRVAVQANGCQATIIYDHQRWKVWADATELFPPMKVIRTDPRALGRVYIVFVNWHHQLDDDG